ncbi:MAG: ATP-binding cassette domain-containing protein [Rhodospirillaceae bacterium]|nr:ATP-binding cassette domain-containing protein [Rhodospirillaceae bacterium]MDE0617203.1 ATP-binding cassette domain-containing protein [Rhodospirillaceae bacterium]
MAPPPLLSLRDAAIGFGGPPLFAGLTLHIAKGDIACLVGRNGCGKSTLMKLIAGELELDAGERYAEPGLTVAYLAQEPAMKAGTRVFDWVSADIALGRPQATHPRHAVEAALSLFELDGGRDVASLSGGEQRRAALAQVFVDPPDLLLLDEPTNHLDIATIRWLEGAMQSFRGAALVVSHDRTFLANVTNSILWLENGRLRQTGQGFGAFDDWCEQVLDEEAREAKRLDSRLRDEARWLLRGVTARRRRNQGRLRKLEEMRTARAALLADTGRIRAKIDDGEVRSKLVIEARDIAKRFGPGGAGAGGNKAARGGGAPARTIVESFTTRILRGDRIGIIGPNGAGKTTLLKMLIGELKPDSGHVRVGKALTLAYFDQQRSLLDPKATLKSTLCESGGDLVRVGGSMRHVRGYLKDWLFDPREAEARVATLSGGQGNRLVLAKVLAMPSDLLILDEPTNDLDMDTLDLLQGLLADYAGTLIVVSHDRDFLDKTVSSTIVLEGDGRVKEYAGGYADYLIQRRDGPAGAAVRTARKGNNRAAPEAPAKTRPVTRLSYKDRRALDLLPDEIATLEAEIAALERELSDRGLYGADPDRFAHAAVRLKVARAELSTAEERWLALETRREEIEAARQTGNPKGPAGATAA